MRRSTVDEGKANSRGKCYQITSLCLFSHPFFSPHQESLEEERRQKTAATEDRATALAELALTREREAALLETVRRLEQEKQELQDKGSQDHIRMREVEDALEAKEKEITEFQVDKGLPLPFNFSLLSILLLYRVSTPLVWKCTKLSSSPVVT